VRREGERERGIFLKESKVLVGFERQRELLGKIVATGRGG
jgi:hypothetical protein